MSRKRDKIGKWTVTEKTYSRESRAEQLCRFWVKENIESYENLEDIQDALHEYLKGIEKEGIKYTVNSNLWCSAKYSDGTPARYTLSISNNTRVGASISIATPLYNWKPE